jgi:hypothetical protein
VITMGTFILLLLSLLSNCAASVYLCIVEFRFQFIEWPCDSKPELNRAVLSQYLGINDLS